MEADDQRTRKREKMGGENGKKEIEAGCEIRLQI